ncbi:MAG: hypothetical protein ACXWJ4_10035 [Methyloceanibacter sp.]
MRLTALMLQVLGAGAALAAAGTGNPMDILAAQLRDQGYACDHPQSAEQDTRGSKPDEAVWIIQCESAKYRMRLVPDMAAKVERIDQ